MSLVRIHQPDVCQLDDSGRTPAFFCLTPPLIIDRTTIAEIVGHAKTIGRDARLCLHDGPAALQHDMIIAQHRGGYQRPHRHPAKGETWQILEGEAAVFLFDAKGQVTQLHRIDPAGRFLVRVGDGQFHVLVPLSEMVVFRESVAGPFTGPGGTEFPDWCPDGRDPVTAQAYLSSLLTMLPPVDQP